MTSTMQTSGIVRWQTPTGQITITIHYQPQIIKSQAYLQRTSDDLFKIHSLDFNYPIIVRQIFVVMFISLFVMNFLTIYTFIKFLLYLIAINILVKYINKQFIYINVFILFDYKKFQIK